MDEKIFNQYCKCNFKKCKCKEKPYIDTTTDVRHINASMLCCSKPICATELLINLNISHVILYFPTCLIFSPDDILYVSDNGNNRLLRIASRYTNGDYNDFREYILLYVFINIFIKDIPVFNHHLLLINRLLLWIIYVDPITLI